MGDIINQLAIFTGVPAFAEKLHVGRPNIGNRQVLMQRINEILDKCWLTNDGPFVQEFERRMAEFLKVKHCVAMCNATVAMEIAIRAAGLVGEVIIPSFTFVATAHALQWQEITPVFCDIDPRTHNIDPTKLERMFTPRTTGIIGVHLWGRACDIESLAAIAERRKVTLMFDAAHALGCSYKGRMIGNFGSAEVFSFHATKFFNTFEGGAVATNDDELAARIRLMKNFGFAGYDRVIYIGTNGKMSEVSAAMGITSLESVEEFVRINQRNYECYRNGLEGIPGIEVILYNETESNNFQFVVLTIDESVAGLSREAILKILHAENVIARRYFYPGCHRMEPYRSYYPHAGLLLPITEEVSEKVLCLPTGTSLNHEDIGKICTLIRTAISYSALINETLHANPTCLARDT
jgi:dTDP-4-amino-4,6-dideoxygalactose transaminase